MRKCSTLVGNQLQSTGGHIRSTQIPPVDNKSGIHSFGDVHRLSPKVPSLSTDGSNGDKSVTSPGWQTPGPILGLIPSNCNDNRSYSIGQKIIGSFHQNSMFLDLSLSKKFLDNLSKRKFWALFHQKNDFTTYSIKETILYFFSTRAAAEKELQKTKDFSKINVKLHPKSIKLHIRTSEKKSVVSLGWPTETANVGRVTAD